MWNSYGLYHVSDLQMTDVHMETLADVPPVLPESNQSPTMPKLKMHPHVKTDSSVNTWWIVLYDASRKSGPINESRDLFAVSENPPAIGTKVDVVTAQNKSTGKKHRAEILKGPFSSSKDAQKALKLCKRPAETVPLPRGCCSCEQLSRQLQSQEELLE